MALSLNFFWHMHQPDYRDGSGRMQMPWVFLHAIKDYYEMPWLLSRSPTLRATFNLTPPLLEQLLLYMREGAECDRFLTLWKKEPRELKEEERRFVEKICRSSQKETMVRPFPRYLQLYGREELDDGELVELEVLFLLSWCGNYLRRHDETVRGLIEKAEGYDRHDKERLLDALLAFLPNVLKIYRRLLEQERISLATTPYNHPILPLLLVMNNAVWSNPATKLPEGHFPLEEDARRQVEKAVELYTELFGRAPTGFWPAEGAVDEYSLSLYQENGIRWIATDEAILFGSLREKVRREALYRRYGFADLFVAFRDHELSDLIGFTYRYWEGEKAAEDFLCRLRAIYDRDSEATVSVILDGENAWEFYPDNALSFFDALYGALEKAQWCQTETMDRLARKDRRRLARLHPGSWIHGTFDTWVGHPEKNAAWELLFRTKREVLRRGKELDRETARRVEEHFLAAECSDWFWWYGEDHHTEYAEEFDALFRGRLVAIYREMGETPPADLFVPIANGTGERGCVFVEPHSPVCPRIDGKESSVFEWLGSGRVEESRLFSTMDRVRGPVERLFWGEDAHTLYLRLEGDTERLRRCRLRIRVEGGNNRVVEIDLSRPVDGAGVRTAVESAVEVAVEKERGVGQEPVRLRIEVLFEGRVLQVLPGAGEMRVNLWETYARHWFV